MLCINLNRTQSPYQERILMKLVTAVIKPFKLEDVKSALAATVRPTAAPSTA